MMRTEATRLATSAGIGVPLGQIIVWTAEQFWLTQSIPSEVAIAVGSVLTGIVGGVAMTIRHFFGRGTSNEKNL